MSNRFRLRLLPSQRPTDEQPGQVASAQGFLSQRMCITPQWGKPSVSVFARTALFQCERAYGHVPRALYLLPNQTGGHIQSEWLSHKGLLLRQILTMIFVPADCFSALATIYCTTQLFTGVDVSHKSPVFTIFSWEQAFVSNCDIQEAKKSKPDKNKTEKDEIQTRFHPFHYFLSWRWWNQCTSHL